MILKNICCLFYLLINIEFLEGMFDLDEKYCIFVRIRLFKLKNTKKQKSKATNFIIQRLSKEKNYILSFI
jgi:hypothetical protein